MKTSSAHTPPEPSGHQLGDLLAQVALFVAAAVKRLPDAPTFGPLNELPSTFWRQP